MRKRADTLFWISIIGSAFVFPVAAIAMFTVWFIRLDLPTPADAIPSSALAATPLVPSRRGQVEVAVVTPPLKAIGELAAPPPIARTPEPLSTLLVPSNASPVYADPSQGTSTGESAGMQVEPATGSLSPQPKQQTAGIAEAAAPQPDADVSRRFFSPPMIATLAVAPPMTRNTSPTYADPTRDALPPASPIMPTGSAAPEHARLIEEPVPLPRFKPHITVAYGSRTLPLSRPRPVENKPGPLSVRP
jgi:hypothetical protein